MKLLKYIICAFAITLGLASCSVTRYKAYAPNNTQLSLQMDDLEYLGESTISVEYRTYLGVIRVIDKINGVNYDGAEIKNFSIVNNCGMSSNLLPALRRANFKLAEEYPAADYFIVTNQKRESQQLFIGSNIKTTAKIKAYSLK